MYRFFQTQIRRILKFLSIATIRKFEPAVVAVTGSVGKTSSKEAIATVLRANRRVRASRGTFNNDIALFLTILGDWRESDQKLFSRDHPPGENRLRKLFFLKKVIFVSAFRLIFGRGKRYPEVLVMEYGADRPGDIKELLEIAKPHIGIVTAIGELPAHSEFYPDSDAVAREKGRLIEAVAPAGYAILNADDSRAIELRARTRAHVLTFGFGERAEVRITNLETKIEKGENKMIWPTGISFKLEYAGNFVPVRFEGVLGASQAYAAAAAACVGIAFNMNLVKIAEALSYHSSPARRAKLMSGIKNSLLIDDSYNASPLSVQLALATLGELPAKRKIAILGDMRELGPRAKAAHEEIGRRVAKSADLLITIGPLAALIALSAKKAGLSSHKVFSFEALEPAIGKAVGLIKQGDIVLIKGSLAMGLKAMVEALAEKNGNSGSQGKKLGK